MARDRQSSARLTSLVDAARALVGRRAESPSTALTVSTAPAAPRRLIDDPATFFGAGQPQPAQAPAAAGRALDYPTFYNVGARPRSTEGVTFAQLRQLADAYDLVRLAIETRKDQLEGVAWTVVRRSGEQRGEPPREVVDFLARPDRDNDWPTWLRMLLEEMLVPDAASIYLRRDRGGRLYAAELIDGTTITPLLDDTGRAPLPPAPAYQQQLKGLAAVDYSREELIYAPRNRRVHKIYGYSPVEQILVTINLALRRQAHQLAYYDESNIPAALVAVPKEWSPQQIREFQLHWDNLFSGDALMAQQRKLRMVPGGVEAMMLHTAPLFDQFAEEWLARVVAFAFSLPPTALVRQNNRATAETVQDAAQDEGLVPLMRWVKSVVDRIIQAPEGLGYADWELQWKPAEAPTKPVELAAIDAQYIAAGVRTARQVAMERFGEYEEPEEPETSDDEGEDDADAGDEAAKAAGRSLRRDPRWY